jgi:ABC-type metal ion transport system, periplasmic component/surface adhesin
MKININKNWKLMLPAKKISALTLVLLLTAAVLPAAAAPLSVAVSIPPQKYFIDRIGGEDVTVTVLTGKGKDPHAYEPTAAQMAAMSKAKLYFAIGVPFETQWLPKFRDINPSLRIISLLDGIERLHGKPDLALRGERQENGHHHAHAGHGHAHDHGLETDDPHVWLSPKVMVSMIPAMTKALSEAYPGKTAVFAERAAALTDAVKAVDTRIESLFASLPPDKRLFMTFHQSWAYYTHAYGLREVSVELEGRDPSPKAMAKLMEFAAQNAIHVIVADPMTTQSAVRAIAKSINGAVVIATPLEEDWPASMTTFSETLAKALQQ